MPWGSAAPPRRARPNDVNGFPVVLQVVRIGIVVVLALGAIVALTHSAVRAGRLSAFGPWPRFIRRLSDPVVRPLERRVTRFGGNPQDAPLWLLGIIVLGGLLLLTLAGWAGRTALRLRYLADAGPAAWLATALGLVFVTLRIALIVRVISSWFGISPYRRWMRPVFRLTDWMIVPLRRVLPTFGPFDLSPVVAYLLLSWLIEPLVMKALAPYP